MNLAERAEYERLVEKYPRLSSLLTEAMGLLRVAEREMDNSMLPLRIAAFLAKCEKEGISSNG